MAQVQNAEWVDITEGEESRTSIRVRRASPAELIQTRRADQSPAYAFPLSPVRNPYYQRDLTTINFAHEAYKINSLIFGLIGKRMSAFAQAKLVLIDKKRPDEIITDPEAAPLLKLLRNPSPLFGHSEWLRALLGYRDIGGTAYIHCVRDGGGQPIQLNIYHASQVMPIQSNEAGEWVDGYMYSNGAGFECMIPKSDICTFKWESVDVVRPYKVIPPLVALAAEVDVDNERARMAISLLINGAIPSFAITAPDGMPLNQQMIDTQAERLMEKLGGRNRGRHILLPSGSSITSLGFAPNQMATDVFEKIPVTRACEVFGVPIQITSFSPGLSASQFKNYEEAQKFFYGHTIQGCWRNLASALTSFFTGEIFYGDSREYEVAFDTSEIGAMQDSLDEMQERATKGFAGNFMTLNEVRAEANLPEDPQYGAMYLWQLEALAKSGATPTAPDQSALQAQQEEALKQASRTKRGGIRIVRGGVLA